MAKHNYRDYSNYRNERSNRFRYSDPWKASRAAGNGIGAGSKNSPLGAPLLEPAADGLAISNNGSAPKWDQDGKSVEIRRRAKKMAQSKFSIQQKPGSIDACKKIIKAKLQMKKGRMAKAARLLLDVLEHEPLNPQAISLLIFVSRFTHETRLAEKFFEYAEQNGTKDISIRHAMCTTYIQAGEYGKAMSIFDDAKDSFTPFQLFGLFDELIHKGNFAAVVEWIESLSDETGSTPAIQAVFADTLRKLGERKEALWIVETALQAMPPNAADNAYNRLRVVKAYCQAELGWNNQDAKLQEAAFQYFRQLLEDIPKSDPNFTRAVCGLVLWNPGGAFSPQDAIALHSYLLGVQLNSRRNSSSAINIVNALEKLRPMMEEPPAE